MDIKTVNAAFFASYAVGINVWVSGNVLQHLRAPWSMLVLLPGAATRDLSCRYKLSAAKIDKT